MPLISRLTDIWVGICCCPHPDEEDDDDCIDMTGLIITSSDNAFSEFLGTSRVTDITIGECGHTGVIITGADINITNSLPKAHIGSNVTGCNIGTVITGASLHMTGLTSACGFIPPSIEYIAYEADLGVAAETQAVRLDSLKTSDPSGPGRQTIDIPADSTTNVDLLLSCILGKTSERYESGSGGPGTVSTGAGDYGGVSYGTYQFSSRGGASSSVAAFIVTSSFSAEFSGLFPGSSEYSDAWRTVAAAHKNVFGQEQHDYVQSIYFDAAAAQLEAAIPGFSVAAQCFGVLELIWSTSVQFGATGCKNIFVRANVEGADTYDILIDKVYKEKSRVKSYFKSSSYNVQQSVLRRYMTEKLQNIANCEGEECDKVIDSIIEATSESMEESIKMDEEDYSVEDGIEDFED